MFNICILIIIGYCLQKIQINDDDDAVRDLGLLYKGLNNRHLPTGYALYSRIRRVKDLMAGKLGGNILLESHHIFIKDFYYRNIATIYLGLITIIFNLTVKKLHS